MIHQLKPYPSMVDSGVPWLGNIPKDWEVKRLKWIAQLNPSKSESRAILAANSPVTFLPMERVGATGSVDASQTKPAASLWEGLTYFRKGDILLAKITPCFENGKGAWLRSLPTEIGFGSTEFFVLRATPEVTPQFLYQVTTLLEFRSLGADAMTGAAGQSEYRFLSSLIFLSWFRLPSNRTPSWPFSIRWTVMYSVMCEPNAT